MKEPLFGKTLEELQAAAAAEGLPRYAGGQLARWLYKRHATSFEVMTDLPKEGRRRLAGRYDIGLSDPLNVQVSADGTKKYLFAAGDNRYIETAYIPEEKRHTLCVSTQAGCRMGCRFCMTGRMGFHGQLTAGGILNQVVSVPEAPQLTNLVYMGMGEPLDNLEEVLKSLEILTSPWGFGWSPRRITVSTIGMLPQLETFLERSRAHLAVSLHTPFDEEREALMPVQHKHPIREIIRTLQRYDWHGQRRLSFEYILFRGLNDTPRHVKELARLLNSLRCRINLIRFHAIPGSDLRSPTEEEVEAFRDRLRAKGLLTTIRRSRGQDIAAACGLLSTQQRTKE